MAKKASVPVDDLQPSMNGAVPDDTGLTADTTESCRVDIASTESDLTLWDLEQLRLPPEATSVVIDEPLPTKIPVRKPNKQEWFRVHPGEEWRFPTSLLILEEDKSVYLVAPSMQSVLEEEVVPACLYTVITRTNTLLLWAVRLVLPDKSSGGDAWYESAHAAATLAETSWVRLIPASRGYRVKQAHVTDEPTWPIGITKIQELMVHAFKDRFITSLDHPVVRQLLEGVQ